MKITTDNWSHCYYQLDMLRAQITYGAGPSCEEIYSVTVFHNEDYQESFQRDFRHLEDAVALINQNYTHFDFINPTQSSDSGCSTCSAH